MTDPALALFGPATRSWFESNFAQPTTVQRLGWQSISSGEHSLLAAPTGSGKTLAAFLWAIDRASNETESVPGTRVLYVSPLKALANDIERNLRSPLAGIQIEAARLGLDLQPLRVDVRTGDTSQSERRQQLRHPGELLVTTPESLYLLLGSAARQNLATVSTVIVDEIHALAPTKRGAHLAFSLERLADLCEVPPQRIGLSATARPLEDVGQFLVGAAECAVIDAGEPPHLELEVHVTTGDMDQVPAPAPTEESSARRELWVHSAGAPTNERGIWPVLYPELVELVRGHKSTILFVNSRGLCERLTQRLNEAAGEELARAHHGSVSHAEREEIEVALKRGDLRAIVATSSLELGIDMGPVDLVVLVESPGSVARGLQRIGRAGHQVGEPSRGRVFPKFKGDLLECAVVSERMQAGAIEAISTPRNPLDVLAQQLVATCCDRERTFDELLILARRAHPFRALPPDALRATLDMLAGSFPSSDAADLRPRLTWDRGAGTISARRGAALVTRLNPGTIPDRGAFAVHVGLDGARIGELDEEMVHESRPGDTFLLGASTWRVEEIGRDRVIVSPAPGESGRLPFWKGPGPGRPVELGKAVGRFLREVGSVGRASAEQELQSRAPLSQLAAKNLADYIFDQRERTGALPTDRVIVVERFRDELGDWRICILSPLGERVHAPWALAIEEALGRRSGLDVQVLFQDDGVVLRIADGAPLPRLEDLFPDPEEIEELVTRRVGSSSLFAALFRENAVRALLITRRRANQRSPLWAQRLKSKALLATVERYPDFPIVLETYRQALSDVFDLGALRDLLADVRDRKIRVTEVETSSPSPFARSLVFAYVSNYLYDVDAPSAERKAQALTLDSGLLRELLGRAELRELLDPDAIADVEAQLDFRTDDRRARDEDDLHDILRRRGDLSEVEIAACCAPGCDGEAWLRKLEEARRAVPVRVAGEWRWIAVEHAEIYRAALGCEFADAVPSEFRVSGAGLAVGESPLEALLRRYARCHGPFSTDAVAARFEVSPSAVQANLEGLERTGELVRGAIRPGGTELDWCDVDVLRRIKRRTLDAVRKEISAVDGPAVARFLTRWHGVDERAKSLGEVLEQLEGLALPWSVWCEDVLPRRVRGFAPEQLDALGATGDLVWIGRGALGARDGRVALYRRSAIGAWIDTAPAVEPASELHGAILRHLEARGASFLTAIEVAVRGEMPDLVTRDLEAAVWDLVWSGQITNDTFQPLRSLVGGRPRGMRRGAIRRTSGPSPAGGRWSSVRELAADRPPATELLLARARTLLDRYGVVSRAAVQHEDLPGGFAQLYRVLAVMEEQGQVRRGWFVDGLSGAQFAVPAALELLRGGVTDVSHFVLSAVDPANPYGAQLPWPCRAGVSKRFRRVSGAFVVFVRGAPQLYVPKSRSELWTFDREGESAESDVATALRCVPDLPRRGSRKLMVIERIDGVPVEESPWCSAIQEAGFVRDYGGYIVDPAR